MRHVGREKYFHIVTDPEDVPIADPPTSSTEEDTEPKDGTSNNVPVTDPKDVPVGRENDTPTTTDSKAQNFSTAEVTATKKRYEPKRYVTVKDDSDGEYLCAEFIIKKNERKTAFKLKNLVDDMTYPLSRSQWLPEASLGSQPYAICREGQSFRRKVKTVHIEEGKVTYSSPKKDSDSSLFILEHGRKT